MKLARLVLLGNILLISGLFATIAYKLSEKPKDSTGERLAPSLYFPIGKPELNIDIRGEKAKLLGKNAKLKLEAPASVIFDDQVELHYHEKLMRPKNLQYTFDSEEIRAYDFILEGTPEVKIGEAILSPKHTITDISKLNIEGNFPLKGQNQIEFVSLKEIKGQLKSLDLLNEKKDSKKKTSHKHSTAAETGSTEKNQSKRFALTAQRTEAPISSYKIRLKFTDLEFSIGHYRIRATEGSFKSGDPILRFTRDVQIIKSNKAREDEYAEINLETGILSDSEGEEISLIDD